MEPSTFSKKKPPPPQPPPHSSAGYFSTSYDDVFGGLPKYATKTTTSSSALAPRAEDYSEIFSGFRTSSSSRASSSIPVLDLPAVNCPDIDSVLDYSDVFGGGLCSVDFAVPFDELFRSSEGFDVSDDDDAAWTPIGTESLSDDSDPFAMSDKNHSVLNENSNKPLEGKQYNVSYHKVNPGMSACIPNVTHIASLNGVLGHSCVVEEAASFEEVNEERFCSQSVEDIVLNMEALPICTDKHVKKTSPICTEKHVKKTSSHLSHEDATLESYDRDLRSHRARSASMSHVNSISASDISLPAKSSHITPPSADSGSPPKQAERKREVNGLSPGPKASERCRSEATFDGSVPPFFDMEVDASSSAAVSAAAMKHVMEKAQAKLNAAREFRGKKDTFQNDVEFAADVNGRKSVEMTPAECVTEGKRSHATNDSRTSKSKKNPKARHSRNLSQILPDNFADEHPTSVDGQKAQKKCSLPIDTAFADVDGEWKEAKQYFEFVNNDSSRSAYQSSNNGNGNDETLKQQDNNDNDSDSAGESCVPQTNRPKLKATKVVSRQGYYDKMVKVVQEVHDTVTSGHAETKNEAQDTFYEDCQEQNPDFVIEPEKNEGRVWDTYQAEAKYAEVIQKEDAEMKSANVLLNKASEARENYPSCERTRNDAHVSLSKEAPDNWEGEREVTGPRVREEIRREAHEGIVELSSEGLKLRKSMESREVKEKRANVAVGDEFSGKRLDTPFESKEEDKTQDMQEMKGNWRKPAETGEIKVGKERLERTCEGQESSKTTEFHQIYEYEGNLEKATDVQRTENMLDQNVELEKCWEYLETMEQEKSKLNSGKGQKLVDEIDSVESQKTDKQENKVEQTSEKEDAKSNFEQAGELGISVNMAERTDFKESQNGAFRSNVETEGEDEYLDTDSFSDIEVSVDDKHQKFPNAVDLNRKDVELDADPCMITKPHVKANGSLGAASGKENGEINKTLLDDNKLKHLVTPDPLADFVPKESAPKGMSQMKTHVSKEPATGKENGDINSDVIDERQTAFPNAQEGHNRDEHEGRRFHSSQRFQLNEKNTKLGEDFSRHDQIRVKESKKVEPCVSDSKSVKPSHLERGGVMRNQGVEENTRPTQSERVNGWNEHPSKRVGPQHVIPDRKQSVSRTPHISSLGQNKERNGKIIDHNGSLEAKDNDKIRDPEMEQLRKLEEEREREREREKDKVAVEVAIREARERAYADARDRAERAALERATEEVRQRAMMEARERLEKACAEARERSVTDKPSETRLRTERAAVERATAEARQRAIEKSMADRAMFEARDRVQRSMSENFSSERDFIMRQSSFPSTSERSETGKGEPAQRCKARLERHCRTVERVAKALAEKNMRDLLAQKEQAERNRFAETLDADIKRWSNGKAGNLRALLSTLQYILGPDSGWQPIPLTEVITAAAVKKAYRKATLCVHPDKLQQRGASIQQKYISEKVFDLLKDAWSRFNSEEK